MAPGQFYVYILASRSRVLYTGVTRDLRRRIHQHRQADIPGFTRKHAVNRLVYFGETSSAISAFQRERQIKSWSRQKKLRFGRECECRVAESRRRLVSQDNASCRVSGANLIRNETRDLARAMRWRWRKEHLIPSVARDLSRGSVCPG